MKTFPFAALIEEERKNSNSLSIDLDLDEPFTEESKVDASGLTSELEKKLSVLPSQSPSALPQMSFLNILSNSDSLEVVTPLTEFIKNSGLVVNRIPQAKKESKRDRKRKKEQQKREKEKKKEKQKEKREKRREKERKGSER